MVSAPSPRPILVPLDASSTHDRDRLFDVADGQARLDGTSLVFLSVVPELYLSTATDPEGVIGRLTAHAEQQQARLLDGRWPDTEVNRRLVRYGPVATTIIDTARELNAGLIVMHARRPGIAAYALGSVASRVVNHADASVYVIREGSEAQ